MKVNGNEIPADQWIRHEGPRKTESSETRGGEFANALKAYMNSVDNRQQEADVQAEKLAMGEGNLHETALALEKANISMRLMVKSRDKVVQAYQEIMRMPV